MVDFAETADRLLADYDNGRCRCGITSKTCGLHQLEEITGGLYDRAYMAYTIVDYYLGDDGDAYEAHRKADIYATAVLLAASSEEN